MKQIGGLLNQLMLAKEELKAAKDKEANLNKVVKKELEAEGITKDTINGIKVNYVDVVKSTLNEDKLVEILQELSLQNPIIENCLQTKIVVDEDLLELFCYEGIIDPKDLQDAYSEKVTKTLKVSRVKSND